ncbi:unnamed protein product [Periconia digitata]|uniref:BTB domain-containing protein n=1 Tax=Periconia digitata TaxID=1303443 RepID=A0A9W4XRB1_9PLEO|nr:unnamed protein product [Periconia digitata]
MNGNERGLLDSLKDSLASGEYSDLTITCGKDTYKVHKLIVCQQSKFFKGAMTFPGKEAQNNSIDLSDDEPDIIRILMNYLYSGNYETVQTDEDIPHAELPFHHQDVSEYTYDFPHYCTTDSWGMGDVCPHHTCRKSGVWYAFSGKSRMPGDISGFTCEQCDRSQSKADDLLIHAKLYEIADKYDIQGLKELVTEKFEEACTLSWNTKSFPLAAHHAFVSTPESDKGLRDIIVSTFSAHMELLKKPEVEALMLEFNGLAFGLLKEKLL